MEMGTKGLETRAFLQFQGCETDGEKAEVSAETSYAERGKPLLAPHKSKPAFKISSTSL